MIRPMVPKGVPLLIYKKHMIKADFEITLITMKDKSPS